MILKTPAQKVVDAAGSVSMLAHLLNVDRTWVWRWLQPISRGGTGGRIPQSHYSKIIEVARNNQWEIYPEDLIML